MGGQELQQSQQLMSAELRCGSVAIPTRCSGARRACKQPKALPGGASGWSPPSRSTRPSSVAHGRDLLAQASVAFVEKAQPSMRGWGRTNDSATRRAKPRAGGLSSTRNNKEKIRSSVCLTRDNKSTRGKNSTRFVAVRWSGRKRCQRRDGYTRVAGPRVKAAALRCELDDVMAGGVSTMSVNMPRGLKQCRFSARGQGKSSRS